MKKRLSQSKGLTLTELIVAVILVGIVMLAVAAMDVAMRQVHQTSSKDAQVKMKVSSALLHLANNVTVATGMSQDPGIVIEPIMTGNSHRVYIRKDGGDPATYDDDQWIHYDVIEYVTPEDGVDVIFCPQSEDPDLDPTCFAPEITLANVSSMFTELAQYGVSGGFHVKVSIESRYDNSLPYDPLDNPQYRLDSKIIPLQHTW